MHIMEGFLPVEHAIGWSVASAPFIAYGIHSIKKRVAANPEQRILLGVAAAFSFVLSALKIPSVTGSCSHPTGTGLGALALFIAIRLVNGYGEPVSWVVGDTAVRTLLSFLNLTKYPPSLDFLLATLGLSALLLAALERAPDRLTGGLAVFGGAPLFFYVVHLFVLGLANRLCLAVLGPNEGVYFSVPNMGWVWVLAVLCAAALWPACRAFIALKARRPHPLLSYL